MVSRVHVVLDGTPRRRFQQGVESKQGTTFVSLFRLIGPQADWLDGK